MIVRDWFRPPRHLLALFVAATVVPALALGWMAWLSLGQDEALDRQRVQDTLETQVGKVVSDLQRRLGEQSQQLSSLARASTVPIADDAVLLTVTDGQMTERPSGRLLYYPRLSVGQTADDGPRSAALDAAAALEFQAENPGAAAEAFRRIATISGQTVRAQALLGLARCLRKAGRPHEALGVYDDLATLATQSIDGIPADLVARYAYGAVLANNNTPGLHLHARTLLEDLLRPRWALDRASFEFYSGEVRGWLPADAGSTPGPVRLALADAASDVDALRRRQNGRPGSGSTTAWYRDVPLLVIWRNVPQEMVALVMGASWFQRPAAMWAAENLAVAVTDAESHVVFGQPDRLVKPVVAGSMADTGLPWTIRIGSADPAKVPSLLARNRRMVFGGLTVVGLLIVVGGFLVARALSRELAVARLQSDFVAAVSHEFRSPLTSMKHLIEMLDQDAVPSEDRRRQYYRVLNGEADRLHQMVENLLNFGRMEAGKAEYRFERLDVRRLAGEVAAAFSGQLASPERLAASVEGPPVFVHADQEALSRAIRNLLDNAAKYSPPTGPIRLAIDADARTVRIQVRDEGPGIPADDVKRIFTKFFRGAGAKTAGVKGTGLGLATVQYIVRAHHGDVLVDSEPGKGSTFTISLPAVAQAGAGNRRT